MPAPHQFSRAYGYFPRAAGEVGRAILFGATGAGCLLDKRFGIDRRFLIVMTAAGGLLGMRGAWARLRCWFGAR
jgi:hypothetical protein